LVSVPSAIGAKLSATAEADPPDDPYGVYKLLKAFLTCPKLLYEFLAEKANSLILLLAIIIAPLSINFWIIKAFSLGYESNNALLPAVVGKPFTSILSLTIIGIPWIILLLPVFLNSKSNCFASSITHFH
jgi:hypothetical protein